MHKILEKEKLFFVVILKVSDAKGRIRSRIRNRIRILIRIRFKGTDTSTGYFSFICRP
jgi:hypothetical protein